MNVTKGAEVAGRYRLEERIATGGMGDVWRATDTTMDRPVAIKMLKPEFADDPTFLERFRAEARHSAVATHPGIATVHDYGEADDTAYLVMELVEGEPLSALLRREGRLPADRTLQIVEDAALALDAAHQAGVIHRDVKPGNILITSSGAVKLTDFGIARAADALPLTQTGTVLGTAHYLSPEQGSGRKVTPASDVYQLGVVAYECLGGHRPFEGGTPVNIAMAHMNDDPPPLPDDVPAPARALVEQAMAKIPSERFLSAGVFAKAASAARGQLAADDTAPGLTATTLLPIGPDAARRGRMLRVVAVVVGALLLLLIAIAARPDDAGKTSVTISPTPTGPRAVILPAGLVGLPYDEAAARVTAAGLKPTRVRAVSTRRTGTVIAVAPTSGLKQGDTVRLTTAAAPPAPAPNDDDDDKKKKGEGKGRDD